MIKTNPITEGKRAPDFSVNDESGNLIDSKEIKKKSHIILYFYPRDNTPGCTLQACDLRDNYQKLSNMPLLIFGVSGDSEKSHQKFRSKLSLPFPLLMDEQNILAKSYGVWGEKKFMGKTFEGIHRTTFIIGKDGIILKTYQRVKPKEHLSRILQYLEELQI